MATGAAFLALLGGVQVAQAGIADGVGDPIGAVENALPNPPETDLDAVVEEATDAVDELTGSVDADAAVSEAKGAVDAAVADPTGTAENAWSRRRARSGTRWEPSRTSPRRRPPARSSTASQRALDPVVSMPERRIGSRRDQAAASGASRGAIRSSAIGVEALAPAVSIEAPARPAGFSAAAPGATLKLGRPGSIASSASALTVQTGAPSAQAGWRSLVKVPASAKPHKVSSAAPAAPFAPPPPGDQPATAASVAGAAGAALLAALFSALFFLAPRTGRLARPGPNLVRAEPCLSLPERPG